MRKGGIIVKKYTHIYIEYGEDENVELIYIYIVIIKGRERKTIVS